MVKSSPLCRMTIPGRISLAFMRDPSSGMGWGLNEGGNPSSPVPQHPKKLFLHFLAGPSIRLGELRESEGNQGTASRPPTICRGRACPTLSTDGPLSRKLLPLKFQARAAGGELLIWPHA